MTKLEQTGMTRLETDVMQAVWKTGGGSVREVQEAMPQELAYTTVQTMLNILERKGHLKRERVGRAFRYMPRVSQEKAVGKAVRELVDRLFGGSSEDLVMSLLKSRQIDRKTIKRLARKLEGAEE